MKNKILLSVILSLFSFPINAQQHFISNNLKLIYDDLSKYEITEISEITNRNLQNVVFENSFTFQSIIHKLKIELTFSERADSVITHIGINIFDNFTQPYSDHLYKFIERHLLEAILGRDRNPAYKNNGVHLLINGKENPNGNSEIKEIIKLINNRVSFKISSPESEFEFEISDSMSNKLLLIFPKHYFTITGMDKKELDEYTYFQLSTYQGREFQQYDTLDISINNLRKLEHNIYVKNGKEIFDGIHNYKYYHLKNKTPQLIYNKKYITESIGNLFHAPFIDSSNMSLQLAQHLYGGKKKNIQIQFYNFLSYFKEDYELYVGFESVEQDTTEVVLVFHQEDFNYLHLATLKIPMALMFNSKNKKKTIYGDLYAYIRTDNIGDVFKGYSNKKNRYKIKGIKE